MGLNKDILWKGLLEWLFEDLLRFLDVNTDQVFDLRRPPVFMDKELAAISPKPTGGMTARVVDKLVQLTAKRRSAEVLVHVEIQGQTKKEDRSLFGARMFRYFHLLHSKFEQPVAGIAIYTGGDGHLFPKSYSYSLLKTKLQYNYETINIWEYSDAELSASENRFAWAIWVAKQAQLPEKDREQQLLEKKWAIFQKLYQHGLFEDPKLQAIMAFMESYLPFEDPEISRTFMERVDSLTGKSNTMDIFEQIGEIKREEGREQGYQAAKEEAVRLFLANTELSVDKIAELTKVSLSLVTKLSKEMRSK